MSSVRGVIYVGMTNDLGRRVFQHKNKLTDGFTKHYNCTELVFWESSIDVKTILEREKQIKRWNRQKKIDLIKKFNPEWQDLSADFVEPASPAGGSR